MIRFWLLAAALIGAVLVFAPRAEGAHSVAHDLQIAEAWAAEYPQHPNHCAGGRLALTFVDTITHDPDGEGPAPAQALNAWGVADGWAESAGTFVWDYAACRARILSGLDPVQRCRTIAHEAMHYVIGPEHTGPLDPAHPGAVACGEDGEEVAALTHKPTPRKRSACRTKYRGRAYKRCLNRRAARIAKGSLKKSHTHERR